MDGPAIETRTEYRIETSEPHRRSWHFLAFTGAANPDLAAIQGRLDEVRTEAREGWKFRLATRQVRIQRGPWTPGTRGRPLAS